MKYQSVLWVAAAKYSDDYHPREMFNNEGDARAFAYAQAQKEAGREFTIFRWEDGKSWRDGKTLFGYRAHTERI